MNKIKKYVLHLFWQISKQEAATLQSDGTTKKHRKYQNYIASVGSSKPQGLFLEEIGKVKYILNLDHSQTICQEGDTTLTLCQKNPSVC